MILGIVFWCVLIPVCIPPPRFCTGVRRSSIQATRVASDSGTPIKPGRNRNRQTATGNQLLNKCPWQYGGADSGTKDQTCGSWPELPLYQVVPGGVGEIWFWCCFFAWRHAETEGAHINPEAEGAHVNPGAQGALTHSETEGAHEHREVEGAHINPEAEGVHMNSMDEDAYRHAEYEGANINPEAEGGHVNPEAEGAHGHAENEGYHIYIYIYISYICYIYIIYITYYILYIML